MILFAQIAVILAAVRLAGAALRRMGQPAVVGEMAAGILLGPSCFGLVAPELHGRIFAATTLGPLQQVGQAGVIVYMFLVGTTIDVAHLSGRARTAMAVSGAGIAVPFAAGSVLSMWLWPWLAPPHVPLLPFVLFIGTAMSITAFPVLARIVAERGLIATPLGAMALACAAVDDVSAWCLLAVVVAIVNGDAPGATLVTVALTLAFTAALLLVVRPKAARMTVAIGSRPREAVALVLVVAFVAAASAITSAIGVHAIFGAFLAGVVVSSQRTLAALARRFEPAATALLVPLFFAVSGLRTEIGRLDTAAAWIACAAIVAVAIGGKFGGVALAARAAGTPWRGALALGALMNTRGLMELIVLNVGYERGILSAPLFAMMVLMAFVTTAMTSPAIHALEVTASGRSSHSF